MIKVCLELRLRDEISGFMKLLDDAVNFFSIVIESVSHITMYTHLHALFGRCTCARIKTASVKKNLTASRKKKRGVTNVQM